ncbi:MULTISPECIES: SCP2 sterol-binding domain-containing protein [Tatumella]|uniref:Ubiquinone biosynthesis accessory factor UbiT n=1 Tax=Tatumella punctata TaxID=399969 RepID=A0ABW1VKH1_9GAMM|nr:MULTISPECIES: SCP2 sterol-binding domain-containing protein [unclassified Tatumella]MBS0856388.1 SCP2 sterol-binding domain-containing protein [Tatumella sp. JGM16]MBS0877394.1 SCP2 sterol-binding domain-containing protein [Tatumella sp. JGM82]MBS0890733.1 SCP2 sterol-binding domain-containing protein [Tatumella sp. JGM94]MBS0893481.1 SCP2 sterol-binding domain-containing protein [Tatumella sp. JGM130]MBS0901791.1 SCP2 sterol-binding domain-containing protein [Tatumella sp. JGM100]
MLQRLHYQLVNRMPGLLATPLGRVPLFCKKMCLRQLINWQYQQLIADGEIDFLQQRRLGIDISDLRWKWVMTLEAGRIIVTDDSVADVWFRAGINDLILLAAGRKDPDMLFFQRRLIVEGDTELGLAVKNLMDAIEPEAMPALLYNGLQHLAAFTEAGMTQDASVITVREENSC